ncbi:MAG: response regulator transcription factor [Opitutales bacterium]
MADKPHPDLALIVEDQTMFRDLVRSLLQERLGFTTVAEAETVGEAREHFAPARFALVVLDFDLPDGDGLDLAREFTLADPHLRVVAISAQNDTYTLTRVLDSGAMGFVDKRVDGVERMEQALRDAMQWRMYFSRSIHEMQIKERSNPLSYRKLLTDKETEMLHFFGMGLSNEEIGRSAGIEATTAQGHRKAVMRKLKLSTSLQLMRYAIEQGFTRVSDIQRRPVED